MDFPSLSYIFLLPRLTSCFTRPPVTVGLFHSPPEQSFGGHVGRSCTFRRLSRYGRRHRSLPPTVTTFTGWSGSVEGRSLLTESRVALTEGVGSHGSHLDPILPYSSSVVRPHIYQYRPPDGCTLGVKHVKDSSALSDVWDSWFGASWFFIHVTHRQRRLKSSVQILVHSRSRPEVSVPVGVFSQLLQRGGSDGNENGLDCFL